MNSASYSIQRIYLTLTALNTLAASFIFGINTLFLLDAGLNAAQAFAANAFFTLGMVVFEVPTGVVADSRGRRASFLLGSLTLLTSTLLYLYMWHVLAPFWGWAIASVTLGLGFTFFSGAVEAWLVDCLKYTKHKGDLESIFAKGQITAGIAMLIGSVAGGLIAQATNLGVPYILRAGMLGITFVVALVFMKDLGFTPKNEGTVLGQMKKIFIASVDNGLGKPSVRWLMLSAPFTFGVGIYAFYAMQPYILELYGDPNAYAIAGVAAAVLAGSQVAGGLSVGLLRRTFKRRTSVLVASVVISFVALVFIGLTTSFWIALLLLIIWSIAFAASGPVRQALLNGLIPSEQRATVLSFDSLFGSAGGVISQPLLGRSADVWGYSVSYVISGFLTLLALPFVLLARASKPVGDKIILENTKS